MTIDNILFKRLQLPYAKYKEYLNVELTIVDVIMIAGIEHSFIRRPEGFMIWIESSVLWDGPIDPAYRTLEDIHDFFEK